MPNDWQKYRNYENVPPEEDSVVWLTDPVMGPMPAKAPFNSNPKKRPQEFIKEGEDKKPPMTSQERAVMFQNILEKRLNPDERNKINSRQENTDVMTGVGKGIEMLLKGMYAGGAGGKDTSHWDRSRDIFRQRQADRESRKDKRLSNLQKLQQSAKAREDVDPTAPASRTLQAILKRKYPDQAKEIDGMSPQQVKDYGKYIFHKKTAGRGATESDADRELKKAKALYYGRKGGPGGSRESEADKALKGAKTRYYDRKPGESDADWMMKNLKMKILSDQAKTSGAKAPGTPAYDLQQKIDQLKYDKAKKALAKVDKTPSSLADKTEIRTLAAAQAKKKSILNQIQGYQAQFKAAKTEDDKIRIGRMMLKTLNSTEGADAIGVEEAKRLGDALEFQIFNLLQPGPMFGRDLKGFDTQITHTADSIKTAIDANQKILDKLGQPAEDEIGDTKKRLDDYQNKPTDGKARMDKVLNRNKGEYPKILYKDGNQVEIRTPDEEKDAKSKGWE